MKRLSHCIDIEHRRRTENEGPDALSRLYEDNESVEWSEVLDKIKNEENSCTHIQART